MILIYSGASAANQSQPDPEKSLGGFISNSQIPSGILNSIFSDISQLALENDTVDTKAFFIKNTTGAIVNNIQFAIIYPQNTRNTVLKYEVAFVSPNSASKIETIINSKATPYLGTFTEPYDDGVTNNQVNIGNLADGASIGVWIRRTILKQNPTFDQVKALFDNPSSQPDVLNTGIRLIYT
jgi:hypothetical protein